MADAPPLPARPDRGGGETLLDAGEVARRVEALAAQIAPGLDGESVIVCLLTGGIWFAADLTRALARLGCNPLFDCLWLASYGDATESGGSVLERSGLQRPVAGRKVLIVDDVIDSGLSLLAAKRICQKAGASAVEIAVFASKPWPHPREITADFVAWEAPARFLVGYGMDHAGRGRGLGSIVALD